MKPPLIVQPRHNYVDLDTGKHLLRLVELMTDPQRLRWLDHCCALASVGAANRIGVREIPTELKGWLIDLYTILGQGSLTIDAAVLTAERVLKNRSVGLVLG